MFDIPNAADAADPAADVDWTHPETPREVLEIEDTVTCPQDIRKAYLRMSVRVHPDKPGGDENAFKRVNEAYRYLLAESNAEIAPPNAHAEMDQVMRDAARIIQEMNVFHEILSDDFFGCGNGFVGTENDANTHAEDVEDAELVLTPTMCVRGNARARAVSARGENVLAPVAPGAVHGHVFIAPGGVRVRVTVRPESCSVKIRSGARERVAAGALHTKGRDVYLDFAVGLSEVILGFCATSRTPDGLHECDTKWGAWAEPAPRETRGAGIPPAAGGDGPVDDQPGSFVMRPRIRPSVDRSPLGNFATAFEKIIDRVYTRVNTG